MCFLIRLLLSIVLWTVYNNMRDVEERSVPVFPFQLLYSPPYVFVSVTKLRIAAVGAYIHSPLSM